MPRFFTAPPADGADILTLTGDDARHIALSLRMACGDTLTLSDGRGTDYACRLTAILPERVTAEIISTEKSKTESPLAITLYQGYPKGDKLDIIVQKATELGVLRVVPFVSAFCIKRPDAERRDKQTARLSRIAAESAGQCGRGVIPEILPSVSFSEMLASASSSDLTLFCYEGAGTRPLPSCLPAVPPAHVSVIVGSEGGFSQAEADAAQRAGMTMCGLGPRILRCETAPLFALSALCARYELT